MLLSCFAKIPGSDVCLRLFVPNSVLLLAVATRRHVQPNTLQTKTHNKILEEIFSPPGYNIVNLLPKHYMSLVARHEQIERHGEIGSA